MTPGTQAFGASCFSEQAALDFVDGRVSPAEREGLLRHVEGCDSCRALLSELARTSNGTRTHPSHPGRQRLLEAGARVGRYAILDWLGAGGMGVVYRAHDPELDRRVALKLLRTGEGSTRPSEGTRLLREAQAMAKLSHPNVVQVYDAGVVEGGVFLAMELVEGETLSDWMRAPRTWREVLRVFLSAAQGLVAAHAAGVIHRDFKPSNVLVGANGRVCVGDFGLARADGAPRSVEQSPDALRESTTSGALAVPLTAAGSVMGTPGYMAPEQYSGETVSLLTDQFSFCASLYEALFGRRPFSGTDLRELGAQASAGKVLPVPRDSPVPERVSRALLRGLSPRPEDRFPSMQALVDALAAEPRPPRRTWALVAGGVLAAGSAGAAVWALKRPAHGCADAGAQMAALWNADSPTALRGSFAKTGAARADREATRTIRAMDNYTSSWAQAYQGACKALDEKPADEQGHLAVVCLTRQKEQLAALTQVILHPDGAVVTRAADAVLQLVPPARCGDARVLAAIPKPPSDPEKRQRADALRIELAYVSAKASAGRYQEVVTLAGPLLERAKALGYPPLTADATSQLAYALSETGQEVEGQKDLIAAESLYETQGMDAQAASASASIAGYEIGRYDLAAAQTWMNRARALVDRAGGDALAESQIERNLVMLERRSGNEAEMMKHAERAAELVAQAYGPEHTRALRMRQNVGIIYDMAFRDGDAIRALEGSLRDWEAIKGPDSLDTLLLMLALSGAYLRVGRLSDSEAILDRAEALALQSKGDHSDNYLRAVERRVILRIYEGRLDEAHALALRALATAREIQNTTLTAEASFLRGATDELLGRPREALPSLQAALDIFQKASQQDPSFTEWPRIFVAAAENDLGQPAVARDLAEKAVEAVQRHPFESGKLALARFQLARALAASGGDRPRVAELIRQSIEEFDSGALATLFSGRVRRWALAHGVPVPRVRQP